jgi:hypothetical protein
VERPSFEPAIDHLNSGPGNFGCAYERQLDRLPHIHPHLLSALTLTTCDGSAPTDPED